MICKENTYDSYSEKIRHHLWTTINRLLDIHLPSMSPCLSSKQKKQIKNIILPGDILLESNNDFPFWQIAAQTLLGSKWSHSAIYAGDGIVVDAGTKPYVAAIPLDEFIDTHHLALLRPQYENSTEAEAVCKRALSYLGYPFNVEFDFNRDDSIYCAQLIYKSLEAMKTPPSPSICHTVCGPIIAPSAYESCDSIKCIFATKPNLVIEMSSHWSSLFAIIAGALLGSGHGYLGAVIGSVVGLMILLTPAYFRLAERFR